MKEGSVAKEENPALALSSIDPMANGLIVFPPLPQKNAVKMGQGLSAFVPRLPGIAHVWILNRLSTLG